MSVSVVIPTHRRAHMLAAALASATTNSPLVIEVLVVDDNLDPAETAAAQQVVDRFPLARLVKNSRAKGGNGARNTGILAAKGEHIAFLDDDDVWLPGKLDAQVPHLDRAGVVLCGFRDTDTNLGQTRVVELENVPPQLYDDFRQGHCPPSRTLLIMERMWFPTSLAVVRRQVLLDVGLFDEQLKCMQDLDLWMRCSTVTTFHIVRAPYAEFIHHTEERISMDLGKRIHALDTFAEKWKSCFDVSLMRNQALANTCWVNHRRETGRRYFAAIGWILRAIWYSPGTGYFYRPLVQALMGKRLTTALQKMRRTLIPPRPKA